MQPSPPSTMKARAVASSPESSRNWEPMRDRSREMRVTSPVASFSPMICGSSASRAIGFVGEAAGCPRRNVVKDDRQVRRLRDGAEMGVQAILDGFIVVGHDGENRVGASGLCVLRQLDRVSRRIGSGSGDDRNAAARDINRDANENVMFRRPQCRSLARRPAYHECSCTLANLAFAELGECGSVDISISSEGRRYRGRVTR